MAVDLLNVKPDDKILDAGCGVGGPMRAIAALSGANVVGITINEYQVNRACMHNKKAGLDSLCEVVCGNFLEMPFPDNTFDGVYSIEATCHAPKLEEVYAEIYRVLKPGSLYVSYEWVTTEFYNADNAEHVEIIQCWIFVCFGYLSEKQAATAAAFGLTKKPIKEIVDIDAADANTELVLAGSAALLLLQGSVAAATGVLLLL